MFTYFKKICKPTHVQVILYQVIMKRDVPASLCKSILPQNMLKKIFC